MPRAQRRCPGDNGNCRNLIRGRRYCEQHTTAWQGERTASSQITSTSSWKKLRAEILRRDDYQCQIRYNEICVGTATVVDKIIPAAQHPALAHDPRNLRASCTPCNDHKARTTDRTAGPTPAVMSMLSRP